MDSFEELTEFEVRGHFSRTTTVYEVSVRAQVMARAIRPASADSAQAFRLFSAREDGARGDDPAGDEGELVGVLSAYGAHDATATRVGKVNHHVSMGTEKHSFAFHQFSLGELAGEPVGIGSKLGYRSALRFVPLADTVAGLAPLRLHYRGTGSPGFDLTRAGGLGSEYRLAVHDPRISRLLVVACVINLDLDVNVNPRIEVAKALSNPFEDWKAFGAAARRRKNQRR